MSTLLSRLSPDDVEAIVSLACSLDEKPGSNWVQKEGGLPDYICRIAKAIKRSGKSTSQAIAIAVSRVKVWATGKGVDAKTQAKAAAAVAQWEKLRGKAHADNVVKASNVEHDLHDLYEMIYNMLSTVEDDLDDSILILAATFEDCTSRPLGTILGLRRDQKDFVALSSLTTKKRDKLDDSDFALPGRRYPIFDEAHARNALARVAQHGTPEEQKKVKAAVKRKYPNIDVSGK